MGGCTQRKPYVKRDRHAYNHVMHRAESNSCTVHDTRTPSCLQGGKHTLWDGGVRVMAWIHSALIPPARRGTSWDGALPTEACD
jgi:hypothetical protein